MFRLLDGPLTVLRLPSSSAIDCRWRSHPAGYIGCDKLGADDEASHSPLRALAPRCHADAATDPAERRRITQDRTGNDPYCWDQMTSFDAAGARLFAAAGGGVLNLNHPVVLRTDAFRVPLGGQASAI